ncbi:hypothetical protein [Lactococcus protaetiae]|nr:hypothetical protein [Lactococcus protaetiae]
MTFKSLIQAISGNHEFLSVLSTLVSTLTEILSVKIDPKLRKNK